MDRKILVKLQYIIGYRNQDKSLEVVLSYHHQVKTRLKNSHKTKVKKIYESIILYNLSCHFFMLKLLEIYCGR